MRPTHNFPHTLVGLVGIGHSKGNTIMKLLRIREVMEITCLSRMTLYRMEKAGDFPRRRRLGINSVAWVEDEVNTWIEARPPIATSNNRHGRTPTLIPDDFKTLGRNRAPLRARSAS
jgi:prophage regulatory protein